MPHGPAALAKRCGRHSQGEESERKSSDNLYFFEVSQCIHFGFPFFAVS
jgi:hypothetical protein